MQSFIVKSIFLFIIFSNNTFAKDFDNLFIITTEIEAENLDKYIDQSFNNLIFRLLGYKDFEKAKIIKGKYNSKDFLQRYAVVNVKESKFLQASFDEEIVMNQFEKYDNIGLYLFSSKKIGKFIFSAGTRYDNNTITLENTLTNSAKISESIKSINPSFNLNYEFKNFDVFSNISSGYETPTLNELSATCLLYTSPSPRDA